MEDSKDHNQTPPPAEDEPRDDTPAPTGPEPGRAADRVTPSSRPLHPTGLLQLAHDEATQAQRLLLVVRMVAKDLVFRSPLPRMAAALAFRTIFGLIPIAVLGLVVLGEVISDEQLEDEITRLLEFTGITQIVSEERTEQIDQQIESERDGVAGDEPPVVDPDVSSDSEETPTTAGAADANGARAPPSDPQGDATPVATPGTEAGSSIDPTADHTAEPTVDPAVVPTAGSAVGAGAAEDAPQRLDDWVRHLIDEVRDVSLRAIGIVGVLVLVYAAFTLIREIERSFNQIYDTAIARSWLGSVFVYWTTITLGAVLLAGTFYVGDWIARQLAEGIISRNVIELVINSGVTLVLLTLAYIGLPNTRVDIRTAIGGAFVATVLWQFLKSAFRLYLQAATGYERLYGEIGLIPLFLFWIYLTWLVILFGLQVSYAMQTFGVWRERTLRSRATHADFVDPASILAVAVALARRFREGTSATLPELARAAGVGEAATADLLGALEDAGVAQALRASEEHGRYSLARPADRIDSAELLELGAALAPSPALADEADLLRSLAAARLDRWRGTTLDQLVELGTAPPTGTADPTESPVPSSVPGSPGIPPSPGG